MISKCNYSKDLFFSKTALLNLNAEEKKAPGWGKTEHFCSINHQKIIIYMRIWFLTEFSVLMWSMWGTSLSGTKLLLSYLLRKFKLSKIITKIIYSNPPYKPVPLQLSGYIFSLFAPQCFRLRGYVSFSSYWINLSKPINSGWRTTRPKYE